MKDPKGLSSSLLSAVASLCETLLSHARFAQAAKIAKGKTKNSSTEQPERLLFCAVAALREIERIEPRDHEHFPIF
jgi:hypothetical protein